MPIYTSGYYSAHRLEIDFERMRARELRELREENRKLREQARKHGIDVSGILNTTKGTKSTKEASAC